MTPGPEEHYVAIDLLLLEALRRLAAAAEERPGAVLRVARIDHVSGRVVFGVKLLRDLDTGEPLGEPFPWE